MVEIVAYVLSSSAVTAIITTLLNRKAAMLENRKNEDAVLMNRISFLESRVEKLEQLVCWDRKCEQRV